MRNLFYARLARQNLVRNRRVYFPYLLTVIGTAAAFNIVVTLAGAELPLMTRYAYLSMFMTIGTFVIGLFAVIFLFYTNSFLMKQRKRELGLYNILGMGKRHIGLMLGFETLYTALLGIGGGLVFGCALQKLVTLLLCRIMHSEAYFGFYLSPVAIAATAVLFGVILLCNLLLNLFRVHVQSPMELLSESSAGEREPKTKWLRAILGILCLGGGYGIAVTTVSATAALALYFIAVFLVIFGTFFLFSAVSIAVLKLLRRNKKYYYQTKHFIGVSGMLYRMKRNAVGLANICILSTMVLVMVSGTLSLYLNSERTLNTQFPGNVSASVSYDPTADVPFDPEALNARALQFLADEDLAPETAYSYRWLGLYAGVQEEDGSYPIRSAHAGSANKLCFLSAADCALTGGVTGPSQELTLVFPDGTAETLTVLPVSGTLPAIGAAFASDLNPVWFVLPDETALIDCYRLQLQHLGDDAELLYWYGFWNVTGDTDTQAALPDTLESALAETDMGEWMRLDTDSRENFSREYYSLNGGFFFLGLFLGAIFVMATVLIIYYKQISEGYEDRERYRIMQKVGMDRKTVRASVRSQILVVFFAPLLVAAVHVAFDFGLMTKLLTLFGLYDAMATFWCTLLTFGVFAAVYALVYWATARVYYRIVE